MPSISETASGFSKPEIRMSEAIEQRATRIYTSEIGINIIIVKQTRQGIILTCHSFLGSQAFLVTSSRCLPFLSSAILNFALIRMLCRIEDIHREL